MNPIQVLIVDDEPRIRRGVERLVLSCGEEWKVAGTLSDGREALEYIRESEEGIDLLITDIKMPEMDGLTLIREARAYSSFLALVLTGYDDFEYLRTALREGAVDYLLKPLDREQFRRRLGEIRARIVKERLQHMKWREMEKKAEKLKQVSQTQVLSYITTAGSDLSHLGYWVEEFPRGLYRLIYISLDALPVKARDYSSKDWEAYFYALENIIAEIVADRPAGERSQGWNWRGGNADFWALIYRPDSEENQARGEAGSEGLAERIRTAVHTFTPFTVSVAYGSWIEDLYLLPEAKLEALSLLNYRLLHGGNRVFGPSVRTSEEEDIPGPVAAVLRQTAERLKQAVEQGKIEEAFTASRQFFDTLETLQSPSRIQRAVQQMLLLIHSAGLQTAGGGHPPFPIEKALQTVRRAVNLQQLKAEVQVLIRTTISRMESARKQNSLQPIEKAKAWIRENLGGEITIKKIADHIYMNPTYFCQVFKMQTGETILDYVTKSRMEWAKELLGDPDLTVQEVARKVGYQDPKYFSRLFKQWIGQSPSKFREAALSKSAE
jgi:two-component system response regulator YesN